MELLGVALGRYVDQRMTQRSPVGGNWRAAYSGENLDADASTLISVILDNWPQVFRDDLRAIGRSLLSEARTWRNDWAHNRAFSDPDTDRALDTVERLLRLIDAPEAAEVGASKAKMPPTMGEREHRDSIPQSPTRIKEPTGPVRPHHLSTPRGPAQQAIQSSISPGTRLLTPGRSRPFSVGSIDEKGIVLLFGEQETPTRFKWECLEGAVEFLKGSGWVEIGTRFDASARSGTLDSYLKTCVRGRATAGWVASLFASAGLVEIDGGRPLRVRSLG
jgi:hypothetical protein